MNDLDEYAEEQDDTLLLHKVVLLKMQSEIRKKVLFRKEKLSHYIKNI